MGLFSFLLASSIGSSLTHRIGESSLTRAAGTIAASITLVGTIFIAVSGPLFAATVAFPISARIGMAIATIFPLALLMGMLFPIGIRLIARDAEDLVPWAWATNGCFSVLGIFMTRITALIFGFSRALALGLLVYLFVLVCLRAHGGRSGHST